MSFTAADVKALREKTGVGMMDCKKALTEADGDMEKAIDFLRERGMAVSAKKAGRIAAEGIVYIYSDEEAGSTVILEVNSESDFVAGNEKFKAFVDSMAKTVLATRPANVDELMDKTVAGGSETVKDALQGIILVISENIKIRRFEIVDGVVATYIHGGGSVGVIVKFVTDKATADKDEFKVMGRDVAMQVAAMSPLYLDEASVPADVIEHEKEVDRAAMAEDPKMKDKPAKVLDGIIEGKIKKYFKEVCLVDQQFVKDDTVSVAQYVANTAKALGSEIKLVGFIRYAKGEGLQKKEENFAEEVQKQMH